MGNISIMFIKSIVVCAAIIAVQASAEVRKEISVKFNEVKNTYDVIDKIDKSYDAYGSYIKDYAGSGWYHLDEYMKEGISTSDDRLKYSKALGFLEGYVSCEEIKIFYPNFYSGSFGNGEPGAETIAFLKANYDWLREMSDKLYSSDKYWYTIKTTLDQIDGLYEGYVAGCASDSASFAMLTGKSIFKTLDNPTLEHFLLINAWGDLYQIATKFQENGRFSRSFPKRTREENRPDKQKIIERCSSIIKLLDDKSDIVFGHATWDTYESLAPRILKRYHFPLLDDEEKDSLGAEYEVYFSSSPALLSSVDDFFLTHVTGRPTIAVQETTNNIYNNSLLELVVPETALSWTRAIAANQLAVCGKTWSETFSKYHSGTYTNQWMVLDMGLFSSGKNPEPGFLYVLEEVPGLVHYEDQTKVLVDEGYWGSYNIPVYEDIAEVSGYTSLCEKYDSYCHDTCPRAKLFKEYQSAVTDFEGGKWIMTYNSFQNDTASLNDSCDAIACRGDLEPEPLYRDPYGALDAKVTTVMMTKDSLRYDAILGPSHAQQPVFCWSNLRTEGSYSHQGQPDCFDYEYESFPPVEF